MSDEQAYLSRITCFIDMLGFTRDVQEIERRPGLLTPIDAVLHHIANCKHNIDQARADGRGRYDARMTHFSDCVVLSYLPEPCAAPRALWDAAFLGHVMLRAGFLPRGAITLGRLRHDDAVVFGGAFLDAYDIERTKVVTPRIVITDPVVELVRRDFVEHLSPELEQSYIRDQGAGPFVHILGREWSFLKKERAQEQAGEFEGDGIRMMFEEVRDMLRIRYQHAPDDKVRHKLEWMRDYVNLAVDEHAQPSELKVTFKAGLQECS